MRLRHWITAIVLLLLMAAAVVGLFWRRELPGVNEEASAASTKESAVKKAAVSQRRLVDLRPLHTARFMATMAGTTEEQALAHEAEKVGDHEVDLAFLDALRTAQETPPPLSPEAKEISAR